MTLTMPMTHKDCDSLTFIRFQQLLQRLSRFLNLTAKIRFRCVLWKSSIG